MKIEIFVVNHESRPIKLNAAVYITIYPTIYIYIIYIYIYIIYVYNI